jgi:hypothetical protein
MLTFFKKLKFLKNTPIIFLNIPGAGIKKLAQGRAHKKHGGGFYAY